MYKSVSENTLAFQLGVRPSTQMLDRSNVPVATVVEAMNTFFTAPSIVKWAGVADHLVPVPVQISPMDEALRFYMYNHAISIIRSRVHPLEPLGKYLPVVDGYHDMLAITGSRMFFYLLLICTRESRHERNSTTGAFWGQMRKEYGEKCFSFWTGIRGVGSGAAAKALRDTPPDSTLGNYTNFLVDSFNKGSYSSSYGGKAWGKIAECLRDYVHGSISLEMMTDTAFTLCHNNGPIFNKGMLYDSYTEEIYRILDVQRSGQIPQYMNTLVTKLSTSLGQVFKELTAALGKELTGEGYVDWHKVEALGSVKKYAAEKIKQDKEHPTLKVENGWKPMYEPPPAIYGLDMAEVEAQMSSLKYAGTLDIIGSIAIEYYTKARA